MNTNQLDHLTLLLPGHNVIDQDSDAAMEDIVDP